MSTETHLPQSSPEPQLANAEQAKTIKPVAPDQPKPQPEKQAEQSTGTDKTSHTDKTSRGELPTHTAYGLRQAKNGKEYFRRIGAGWEKPGGGLSIFINDKREADNGRVISLHRNPSPERER